MRGVVSILLILDIGLEAILQKHRRVQVARFNPSYSGYRPGSRLPVLLNLQPISVSILLILDIGLEAIHIYKASDLEVCFNPSYSGYRPGSAGFPDLPAGRY